MLSTGLPTFAKTLEWDFVFGPPPPLQWTFLGGIIITERDCIILYIDTFLETSNDPSVNQARLKKIPNVKCKNDVINYVN